MLGLMGTKPDTRTKLRRWLDSEPHGTGTRIAKEASISTVFLWQVAAGERRLSHETALRVARATGLNLTDLPYTRTAVNDA